MSRIALVTDWIYGGGGEKVVEQLHKLYPEAPIYTSYCSKEWRQRLNGKVVTGYLQYPPFKQLRKFLPLLRQWWFARLDLSNFDVVISITGNGEAKFIKAPNGKHISYCHTPNHFYWRHYEDYLKNPGFRPKWLIRLGMRLMVKSLKKADYRAAQLVDVMIANSSHIKEDIKTFYDRDSQVIYPPVDITHFTKALNIKKRQGFITMGRQVPLKRTDLLIQTCNKLKLPLTVIGRGPEHDNLVKIAGPTIKFKTDVTDEQMPDELSTGEAFLFASYEDFGIAPIEAMATGTPVIAFKAGGALDYIQPGKTGEFFSEQSIQSIKEILEKFNSKDYDPKHISNQASKFSSESFRDSIIKLVKQYE